MELNKKYRSRIDSLSLKAMSVHFVRQCLTQIFFCLF
ncbi:hypothetical protein CsSME_00016856 [Camellia sinensis var. sinensis]